MLLLLLSCTPTEPGELLLDPDPTRSGEVGSLGPHGAAWLTTQANVAVEETVQLEVVFPADEAGELAVGGPFPAVIWVQGGAVDHVRYRWLSGHLATRGYLVISADHVQDLALFQPDNSMAALDRVETLSELSGTLEGAVDPGAPAAVMGHSLGGVVAPIVWLADRRVDSAVIVSSFPADSTAVEDATSSDGVLSIVGSEDGQALPADCLAGLERFPEPRWFAEVQGMTHWDWIEDPLPQETENDGTATRPTEESRADALRVVDTFLDARLRDDPEADQSLAEGAFPGVELQ